MADMYRRVGQSGVISLTDQNYKVSVFMYVLCKYAYGGGREEGEERGYVVH